MIQDSDFPTDPKELPAFYAAHIARETGVPFNAALGIVQRLQAESGSNFSQLQEHKPVVPGSRGGAGIAMWTGPRRTDAESATSGIGGIKSPSANLAYLVADLKQNYQPLLQALQDPKMTTQEAYNAFTQGYEYNKGPYAGKGAKPVQLAKGPDPLDFETQAEAPAQPTQTTSISPTAPVTPSTPTTPATVAPTKPSGDPLDFENTAPAPSSPAATSVPTPSPDNPTEGKGAAATPTGPQPSLMHDIGAGLVQGGRGVINAITNPSQMVIGPLARVGAAGYNLLAPHIGLPQMTPEQMADINGTGAENGGVNTGTPGQLVTKAVGGAMGAPQPEEVPAAMPMVRNAVANGFAGTALGGPAIGAASAVGTPVIETASSLVPPQYQPAAEDLMALPLFGGMTSMIRPKVPEINPLVAKNAQASEAAGGPAYRTGQLASNPDVVKADLRNNVDATNNQIQQLTQAFTEKAGLKSDVADQKWATTLRKDAGDKLNTYAAKTGVDLDTQLGQKIQDIATTLKDPTTGATSAELKDGTERIQSILDAFKNGNGRLDGKAYQNLTRAAAGLTQDEKKSGPVGEVARSLRGAIDDALSRSSAPEDVAGIRSARNQYRISRASEDVVDNATGLINPQKLYREFQNEPGDIGDIARAARSLPPTTATGGVRAPGMRLPHALALTVGSPLAALEAHNLLTQYGGMLAEHPYLSALGALGAAGTAAAAGARKVGAAYMNRPDQQRAMIARAAMGAPPPPAANMLLPGVLGTQGQNQ